MKIAFEEIERQAASRAEAAYQYSLEPQDHDCFDCVQCERATADVMSENLSDDLESELGFCEYLKVFVSAKDTSGYWECEQ